MMILWLVLLVVLLLWTTGFLLATDFVVPLRKREQFQRVLVIFPHADDEVITCAGFLHRLAQRGSAVTLVFLTKGEKGPNPTRAEDLKDIRTREARAVSTILGVSKLIQEDLGDGSLRGKKPELTTFITSLIEQEKPDLLLTYDLSGLYGHPDHIACSEVVTELQKTSFPEIPLWYVTFPKRMLARLKLPDDLAIDPHFREKQVIPTHKIWIGASVFPKIKAWYTYKSQRASLTNGIGKFASLWFLWFLLSLVLFEYFADESDSLTHSDSTGTTFDMPS